MNNEKDIKRIAIVGLTASGKSSLAIALAKELNGEVISADSMQVYKGADIGTAKVTEREQQEVKHHLIDILSPEEEYSASRFSHDCAKCEEDIISRGKTPIICGGTGLYIDSFLRGGYEDNIDIPKEITEELEGILEKEGKDTLWELLYSLDKEAAEKIHKNNTRRVIRAIGLIKTAGKTKTELDMLHPQGKLERPYKVIALGFSSNEARNEKIGMRVDEMFREGLIEEALRLKEEGFFSKCKTASQAIGYKELMPYLCGREDIDAAKERLKTATRRYAKRQRTWFSSMPYVSWIETDGSGTKEEKERIFREALRIINE